MNNLPPDPTITPTQTNYAFRYFCQKVLPTVYDESLSYYELLCKLTAKINEVISANNTNGEAVTELQNLYVQLKSYVDNYFKNLDLQPEIDEALNRMAESGDLATLISQYLNGINIYGFRTINDMKNAETIGIGSICRTLGDTDYKTGNGKFYYVRQYLTTDNIDDDNIIALINNPQAVAEKIPDYFYNTITSSIGDLSNLTTTDKTSTVGAINEVKGLADTNTTMIGTLSNLTTTEKTNTVGAINEVKGLTDTNATSIGTLSNLTTTEKTNTVGAINEIKGIADNLVSAINETVPITRGGTGATTKSGARTSLEVMKATTLYQNDNGTSGTITLSETSDNFDYVEVFFRSDGGSFASQKIFSPNGKSLHLFLNASYAPTYTYMGFTSVITFSGNSVTWENNNDVFFAVNTLDAHNFTFQRNLYIYKIVGYNY